MNWQRSRKPWRPNVNFVLSFLLTKDDITKGLQDNCEACPIARAITKAIPTADDIAVGGRTVRVNREGYSYYFALTPISERSASAVEFIHDFDKGSHAGERMDLPTILKRWAGTHFSLPYLYSH